jgi:hypothetical protein
MANNATSGRKAKPETKEVDTVRADRNGSGVWNQIYLAVFVRQDSARSVSHKLIQIPA